MRTIITLLLSVFWTVVGAQSDSAAMSRHRLDSTAQVLSIDLQIKKEKALALMEVLSGTSKQMTAVARERSLSREQKDAAIGKLAKQRDLQIAALLTEAQIGRLKELFRRQRGKVAKREGKQ